MSDLRWYQALALWKAAVFMEGNYKRSLAGTTDDPFLKLFDEGVPMLAEAAHEIIAGTATPAHEGPAGRLRRGPDDQRVGVASAPSAMRRGSSATRSGGCSATTPRRWRCCAGSRSAS